MRCVGGECGPTRPTVQKSAGWRLVPGRNDGLAEAREPGAPELVELAPCAADDPCFRIMLI